MNSYRWFGRIRHAKTAYAVCARESGRAGFSPVYAGKHSGPKIGQAANAKAEQIVQQELQQLGWGPLELKGHAKGHLQKIRIAKRLRRETTMTLKWIANRLQMGVATHVAHLLYRYERNNSNNVSADTLF